MSTAPASVEALQAQLASDGYLADRRLATSLFLSLRLNRPLFLEGEAGVGKTELAKALAHRLGAPLIRLQCYEGLDVSQAAYEWNVGRQLLHIRLAEAGGAGGQASAEQALFSREMLLERPLLAALSSPQPVVLLIDELDRADEPFEAFLLEVLSDWQITIPELGTVKARHIPHVIITSNRTREIHDALKRRCLYHWVEFPDLEREFEIVRSKVPQAPEALSRQVVATVQRMRSMDLFKSPGIAETIDWVNALVALDKISLDPDTVADTLGVLLKYQEDIGRVEGDEIQRLLREAAAASRPD
ncbi:MAG: MoxR family ATPase [Burkholderiales bacterium]